VRPIDAHMRRSGRAAAAPDDGALFQPGSVLRKIGRESVGLLGGGRALLLQLAHPLIAAAVAEHSQFQAAPLHRLEHTLDLMHAIVFGSGGQARAALRQFHASHAHVRGRLAHSAGPYAAGDTYSAHDPGLNLWVLAALLDTQLLTYERFVAPLASAERQRFLDEARLLGALLGIPPAMMPATPADFRAYMDAMLAGDTLCVTDSTRALAWAVLDPPVGLVPRACAALVRFVTAGLLPERLRHDYGMAWDARRQAGLDALGWASRRLLPFLPAWLRRMPGPGGGGFVRWAIHTGKKVH
jgi:uncharacterized protein (DUF2236 family)